LPDAGLEWPKQGSATGFSYLAREIYKILIPPSLRESPAFAAP
jgi:hypothetical protein